LKSIFNKISNISASASKNFQIGNCYNLMISKS
jgi:hypothetical protein